MPPQSRISKRAAPQSFEEIKKEFHRIQQAFSQLLFDAETFEEGRLVLKTEQILIPQIVDKLRLMNDLRNLDQIALDHQKENSNKDETI